MNQEEAAAIQERANKLRTSTHLCIQTTAAKELVLERVRKDLDAPPEAIARAAGEWRAAQAQLAAALESEVAFYKEHAQVVEVSGG